MFGTVFGYFMLAIAAGAWTLGIAATVSLGLDALGNALVKLSDRIDLAGDFFSAGTDRGYCD
jgi:hypothetical protein